PALADLVPLEEVPGPRLHDDAPLGGRVEQRPLLGNAVPVLDVELGLPEGGAHLRLDDLDPRPRPGHLLAVLDVLDLADVETDRGVELQGPPAGGGLG